MSITFGIITGGGQTRFVNEIIDSIENEKIPEYEIIVVGSFQFPREKTFIVDFPENIKPLWITKKKNIIGQYAQYETIVFLHDYIVLEPGWYKGFLKFQEENSNWDVGMCKIKQIDDKRGMDWMGLPNDNVYGNVLLPYDYKNPKGMYVPGNFFMVKKEFFQHHPLDESRTWCEGEDIEWSKRIFGGIDNSEWLREILNIPMDVEYKDPENPANYCMNQYSSVKYLKEKHIDDCFRETYDTHSGDNSRPRGYTTENYTYMTKRSKK